MEIWLHGLSGVVAEQFRPIVLLLRLTRVLDCGISLYRSIINPRFGLSCSLQLHTLIQRNSASLFPLQRLGTLLQEVSHVYREQKLGHAE